MTKVLETDSAAVTTGPKLFFDAAPGSVVHYDNIRVRNNDGDIRSFSDDFSDGDYTADPAWTAGGPWTVTGADNHMQNTVSGSSSWFRRAAPCEDFVLDFTYVNLDDSNNLHRVVVTATDLDSPNQDGVEAQFKSSGMQLFQKVSGTSTSLDYIGTSSIQGTKYRVRIVRDGSRVEVWRGAENAPMTKMLESDAITVGAYDRLTFAVSAGAQFAVDDIDLRVDDPETMVYTHNAANELLAMDGPAALARFDYDAWGRTVTKRRVSGAATHRASAACRFPLRWPRRVSASGG
jgi:YD repeat-containing protein